MRPVLTWRRAACLALAFALPGCATDLDRDQARLCRLAAAALAPEGAAPTEVRQRTIAAPAPDPDRMPVGPAAAAVRIDFHSGPRAGFVECTFGQGAERLQLAVVRTERGLLSLPQLSALEHFWLATADAAAQDPMPIANAAAVPTLPPNTAYMLQQFVNAIPSSAVYALLAVAYALVYGLIGRINLAFGAFTAVGGGVAVVAVLATQSLGVGVALVMALVGAVLPPLAYGVAAARLVFKPLARASGQQVLVATIGLALFVGEALRIGQGEDPRWVSPLLETPLAIARDASFVVTVTPIAILVSLVAAAASLGLAATMRLSAFGRNWRAYRDDPGAAALFGVGRDRILAQTFALASACAGLAGGITVVFFGDISFAYAQVLALKALTAAVLGGIGSVSGAFVGGLFIGVVEAGWSAAFPIVNRDLVTFCILVVTLIWRPGGFLGERDLVPRRV